MFDDGKFVGRIHACVTECSEDPFRYNDWISHVMKRKTTADATGDETYGAKDTYTVKVWAPRWPASRSFQPDGALRAGPVALYNGTIKRWGMHGVRR